MADTAGLFLCAAWTGPLERVLTRAVAAVFAALYVFSD